MYSFDIDALLRFTPPLCLCERCFGLLGEIGDACPVCGVRYVASQQFPTTASYLAYKGLDLHFDDLIAHCRDLAQIARSTRDSFAAPQPFYLPMRALLAALQTAERFVHFTTYGISALLLGALKLTAQTVDVRGIIAGVKTENMLRELTDYKDEAPRLNLRLYQESQFFPHQKIVVIDGLLAFKGSANMTDFGWRKAAHGREVLEPVTDVAEVVDLHNRFFSPVWAAGDTTEKILMSAD
ncbi:MAG: phospholipase D-like domain-containing protein [Chloroflexota bacterium]